METAEHAWRRSRKIVMAKIEQLESLVDGKPPRNCNFQHVGDLCEVSSLLDKALHHVKLG